MNKISRLFLGCLFFLSFLVNSFAANGCYTGSIGPECSRCLSKSSCSNNGCNWRDNQPNIEPDCIAKSITVNPGVFKKKEKSNKSFE